MFMPLYPNFLNYFCKAFGMIEGIAIMPQTLAQARHQNSFIPIVNYVQYSIGAFTFIFAVFCYLAYGSKTQEIILMNQNYGLLSNVLQGLYTVSILFNITMNTLPILDVFENTFSSVKRKEG